MIRGIGVDLVEVNRLEKVMERWGTRFIEKVFTPLERRYCSSKHNPSPHYAARFAAKEAVAKALATGWSGGFRWKDVEVTNDDLGKPSVILHGQVKTLLKECQVLISISHTEEMVIASAIIETPARN